MHIWLLQLQSLQRLCVCVVENISTRQWMSEQFLNGTSAYKKPFSALNVLSKNNYVNKIAKYIKNNWALFWNRQLIVWLYRALIYQLHERCTQNFMDRQTNGQLYFVDNATTDYTFSDLLFWLAGYTRYYHTTLILSQRVRLFALERFLDLSSTLWRLERHNGNHFDFRRLNSRQLFLQQPAFFLSIGA